MTIEMFAVNNKIKNKETILKWLSDDLIPGANIKENYIPDSARVPYTKARAKTMTSIYKSIVYASKKRYHVLPKMYNLCDAEFNECIQRLVEAKVLVIRVTDNITYYDVPFEMETINESILLKIIESCAKGITTAYLEYKKIIK